MKSEDLTGRRFGHLTVIKMAHLDKSNKRHWECVCDCGNITYPSTSNLKSGNSYRCKSCGNQSHYEDLTGQRFGRLIVQKIVSHKPIRWECKCDCGNTTIVIADTLKRGETISCGCYRNECVRDRSIKHNESHTKLHQVWSGMKTRCNNPNFEFYKDYGGRGIKVCDEWQNDYIAFRDWALQNGYAEGLSIDRIDVNGNYEPSNCRWVTDKVQANNKTTNRFIEYKGETHTLQQWSEILGVSVGRLFHRLDKMGWSVEKTFETGDLRKKRIV